MLVIRSLSNTFPPQGDKESVCGVWESLGTFFWRQQTKSSSDWSTRNPPSTCERHEQSETSAIVRQILMGNTENVRQVTSYREIFNVGSHPQIHSQTTISPTSHDTSRPGRGSFEATHSQNGKHPDQVHFFGYMGAVCSRQHLLYHRC